MALFYPAAIVTGAWFLTGYTYDLKQKQQQRDPDPLDEQIDVMRPFQGPTGHISQYVNADQRQFRSVRRAVDHLGADIFLVDYGNGAETIQYIDPRVLL